MICLTGDLHHASLGTGNQRHADFPEIVIAQRFLERVRARDIKVTFFVTGRAFDQEWDDLRPICADAGVEIGGHTYTCFQPALFHRASKKLLGSYPGPRAYERFDIRRTIAAVRRRTGKTIRAWRNHMYLGGPSSHSILEAEGIHVISDVVRAAARGPRKVTPFLSELPINVIPDHEHLFHAERTPAWVAGWKARYGFRDDFGSDSYFIDEWADLVIAKLRTDRASGALSTLIIHPITMYLCDRFAAVDRILDVIAEGPTVHVSEAAAMPTNAVSS